MTSQASTIAIPTRQSGGVLVHNSDGVSPYAAELASLLNGRLGPVTVVDAANSDNRPPDGVRWRALLPKNFAHTSPVRQVAALLRGLGATVWASVAQRQVVLVAATRFPLEDLLLAGLAAVGRPVVVVVHNPEPREAESRLARIARRALLARASAAVVHAERLRDRVDRIARGPIHVCPHPPYVHSISPATPALTLDPSRTWVAFIGALRWDKGAGLVPDVLAAVPEAERHRLGLVMCGRGSLPAEDWQRIRDLGVEVCDLTSDKPVPHEVLLDVLRNQPLVLAPYVAATQSGSVILALSMGCRVIAFDEGGIPDVLTADGLVPTGDVTAMAQALVEGRAGTAVEAVPQWAERTADAWEQVVRSVQTSSDRRSTP